MALLTVQEPTLAGITPTYAAADVAGDTFAIGGGTYLIHIKNSGTQKVATFTTPGTIEGVAISDPTVTIPATTGDKLIKLTAPQSLFANSSGLGAIAYDGVTGATIAIFKV
jgi:hypothetical protein